MADESSRLNACPGAGAGETVGHGTFERQAAGESEDKPLERDTASLVELIVLNSFVGAYGLIQVSMFMLVLPKQCELLFPGEEAVGLAVMLGLAGATQLVCPVAGLFSDRMTSPFGRRRPFIVVGTMVALMALLVLWYLTKGGATVTHGGELETDLADSRVLYMTAFVGMNLALNVCFAAYAGLIPDFVKSEQLGEASGIMAVMNAVGALLGVWMVGFLMVEPFSLYSCWLVICCALTLVVVHEQPHNKDPGPLACADILSVYFESLHESDFFWVWVSRLLYYMGISVQVFMQYFIRDIIGIDEEEAKMQTALVSITMLACTSLIAVPCGMLSDKVGRRPLVYISCALMAFTYLGWTLATKMWHILIWSALFGLANGTYLSVDYALGCDVIPDKEEHAAQALGVWGVAAFLGTTLGPVISGPVLFFMGRTSKPDVYSHRGYSSLLAIGALLVLASSVALKNLRLRKRSNTSITEP